MHCHVTRLQALDWLGRLVASVLRKLRVNEGPRPRGKDADSPNLPFSKLPNYQLRMLGTIGTRAPHAFLVRVEETKEITNVLDVGERVRNFPLFSLFD